MIYSEFTEDVSFKTSKPLGKYRAIVTNTSDPKNQLRIKCKIPYVLGEYESSWCLPCLPFTGVNQGIFKMPDVGDGIWVEFEDGDINKPVYTGSWVLPNNIPENLTNGDIVIISKSGLKINIDNTNNEINIETNKVDLEKGNCRIRLKDDEIVLQGNVRIVGTFTHEES